ncbi:MAG: hypothetical protein M3O91_07760 [Chloroflexota bacterium]|nr:hypothetical protein [Chloroflexota bacterium]
MIVLAFWSGNFPARAITGALELAVIVGWWGWAVRRGLSEGFGRISVPKLSVVLGLTTLVVGSSIGVTIPVGLITALDHAMFIGVMTNALFGCVLALTAAETRVWPWADHVIFWGLNIGAASFLAVLVFVGTSAGAGAFAHPVAYTAPIMGLSALLGVATLSVRLGEGRRAVATTRPAQRSMV